MFRIDLISKSNQNLKMESSRKREQQPQRVVGALRRYSNVSLKDKLN